MDSKLLLVGHDDQCLSEEFGAQERGSRAWETQRGAVASTVSYPLSWWAVDCSTWMRADRAAVIDAASPSNGISNIAD